MSKRNVLNSPRLLELKKRRHKTILNKVLIFSFGFIVLFIASAYFSNLNSLKIQEIQIAGNKVIDTRDIRKVVDGEINGKYLWFFPRSNVLFYPKSSIKDELQNEFQRLKDINLAVKDNKVLEITLGERDSKFIWCGVSSPQIGIKEKCYFMDENGYIFDEAPYFSGEVYFKFYGPLEDQINPDESIGAYFSKQSFKYLTSFKNVLTNIKLKPVALSIAADKNIEILLSSGISSKVGPKILLKTDSDFQTVAENLQTALTAEPLQSEFKNKYSLLQYIDLRFGNKVYYKFSDSI
jgi:hypothetical protein